MTEHVHDPLSWVGVENFEQARALVEHYTTQRSMTSEDLIESGQRMVSSAYGRGSGFCCLDGLYRLRAAVGASYVLLILKYGDRVP